MTGLLASSKAGHDKDKIYVIIREDREYVWLADGKFKTIANLKKKRKKHIQLIKCFNNEEIRTRLLENVEVSDLEIVMALKKYKQQMIGTGGK